MPDFILKPKPTFVPKDYEKSFFVISNCISGFGKCVDYFSGQATTKWFIGHRRSSATRAKAITRYGTLAKMVAMAIAAGKTAT